MQHRGFRDVGVDGLGGLSIIDKLHINLSFAIPSSEGHIDNPHVVLHIRSSYIEGCCLGASQSVSVCCCLIVDLAHLMQ